MIDGCRALIKGTRLTLHRPMIDGCRALIQETRLTCASCISIKPVPNPYHSEMFVMAPNCSARARRSSFDVFLCSLFTCITFGSISTASLIARLGNCCKKHGCSSKSVVCLSASFVHHFPHFSFLFFFSFLHTRPLEGLSQKHSLTLKASAISTALRRQTETSRRLVRRLLFHENVLRMYATFLIVAFVPPWTNMRGITNNLIK